ncbi:MAG: hypothetical protein R3B60_01760 [Candidatus Paceibacterota bacterium]
MNNCYRCILSLQNYFIELQNLYYIVLAAHNHYLAEGANKLNSDHFCEKVKAKLEQSKISLDNLLGYKLTILGNLNRLGNFGVVAKTQNYIKSYEDWEEVLSQMNKGKISPVFAGLRNEIVLLETLFCKLYDEYSTFTTTGGDSISQTSLVLGTKIEKIMSIIKIIRLMYELVENSKDGDVKLEFIGKTKTFQTKSSSQQRSLRLRLVK